MLRKLRIAAGAVLLAAVTWYFVDFAGILPDGLGVLARIQFFPAFFMHSVAILMGIVALTCCSGGFTARSSADGCISGCRVAGGGFFP